ncbi:hypothetical protein D3C81_1657210 [compost metagenome]
MVRVGVHRLLVEAGVVSKLIVDQGVPGWVRGVYAFIHIQNHEVDGRVVQEEAVVQVHENILHDPFIFHTIV